MINYVNEMKEALGEFFISKNWRENDIDGRKQWARVICRDIGYSGADDKELRELADYIWDESCKGILRGWRIDFDKKDLISWIKEGKEIRENEKT